MDRQQQKPKKHTPKKFGAGIALDKFGKMKKSSFDKRAKLEKESKLNAARVNKYKKLKAKLADKLQPKVKLNEVRREPGVRGAPTDMHAASGACVPPLPASNSFEVQDLSLEGEDEQQPSSSALEEQHVQQNAAAEQPGEQQPQQHPGHAQLEGQGGRGGRKDGRSTSGRGKHKLPSHMQRIAAKVQAEKVRLARSAVQANLHFIACLSQCPVQWVLPAACCWRYVALLAIRRRPSSEIERSGSARQQSALPSWLPMPSSVPPRASSCTRRLGMGSQ